MQRKTIVSSKLIRGTAPVLFQQQPMQQAFEETEEQKKTREAEEAKNKGKSKTEIVDDDDGDKDKTKAELAQERKDKKLLSWLNAEKDHLLEAERDKNRTADEKAVAKQVKEQVAAAVQAKEVEITDAYEEQLSGLRKQIIDTSIDSVLAESGIKRDDVKDLLETLDITKFIGDDGLVKVDSVKKALGSLTVATNSRPPRSGGSSRVSSDNRGMGRYLPSDK